MSPVRVLAIGGTGFVSRSFVEAALRAGHDTAVVVRGKSGTPPEGAAEYTLDRSDVDDLSTAIRDFAPDVIVDTCAMNLLDATTLIEAQRRAENDARVVVVSSVDVYRMFARFRNLEDGPIEPAVDENAPLRRVFFPYRSSPRRDADEESAWLDIYDKRLVETAYRAARPDTSILRLPFVFGARDKQRRLRAYVSRIKAGEDIAVSAALQNWRASRVFDGEVADALVGIATTEQTRGRPYVLGADRPDLTEKEWIESVGRVLGWVGSVTTVEPDDVDADLVIPADLEQYVTVDGSGLRRDVSSDVPPREFEELLRVAVAWEAEQGE